jgi:MoxR-like ATPase
MLIATQNPVEFQGVYPLPEGQVDRFMVKITLDYPRTAVESRILKRNLADIDSIDVAPVLSRSELDSALDEVGKVKVSDEIMDYLAEVAKASRMDTRVRLGASPRSVVHLVHCARAYAFVMGRNFVIPDDIKYLSQQVLAHRIRLDPALRIKGQEVDAGKVVAETLDKVKPPR